MQGLTSTTRRKPQNNANATPNLPKSRRPSGASLRARSRRSRISRAPFRRFGWVSFVSGVTANGYGWGGLLGTGTCMGSCMRMWANVLVIYSCPWICRLRRIDLRAVEQDLLPVKRH